MDSNVRVLPRVCVECKDLIFTTSPIERLYQYDKKKSEFIEVCKKCKDKWKNK